MHYNVLQCTVPMYEMEIWNYCMDLAQGTFNTQTCMLPHAYGHTHIDICGLPLTPLRLVCLQFPTQQSKLTVWEDYNMFFSVFSGLPAGYAICSLKVP